MSDELIVVKSEILETATVEQDLVSLNLAVGESINLFDGIIECTVTPKFSMLIYETDGIRAGNDGYYKIAMKILKNDCIHHKIQRVTNFIIKPINRVILQNFNHQEKLQHIFEVAVKVNDKIHNVILTNAELSNIHKFEEKVSEYAHVLNIMNDNEFRITISRTLSQSVPIITEFKTAGYNIFENQPIFVTANGVYGYGTKNVLSKH